MRGLGTSSKGYERALQKAFTQGMVIKDGAKMSKSLGNVVDPDEIIKKLGLTQQDSLYFLPRRRKKTSTGQNAE